MNDFKYIPASQCRPYLKKILSIGGSALILVGDEYRTLQHFPNCDRPSGQLPWPLSKLQPFRFRILLKKRTKGKVIGGIEFPAPKQFDGKGEEITFDQNQVEEGLGFFLSGASPYDEVSICYRPDW